MPDFCFVQPAMEFLAIYQGYHRPALAGGDPLGMHFSQSDPGICSPGPATLQKGKLQAPLM